MSAALEKLLRERAVLQARSGMLRHEIAQGVAGTLARPLGLAARVQGALQSVLRRPSWLLALTTLGLLLRPQRAARWSAQAWAAWRVWRGLKKLFSGA